LPKDFAVALTIASSSASFATSQAMLMALPPAALMSAATLAAVSAARSLTITEAPAGAKVSGMLRPMPAPAPVTMAT
jgi:hypothetical protein